MKKFKLKKIGAEFAKEASKIFALDLRSLALFRIGMAILIIIDLLNRSTDLKAFYTDYGVLPRTEALRVTGLWQSFSFHLLNGEIWFQGMMLLIAGLFAVGLLVGYKTRTMTILSWIMLVSLHNRQPAVLQGGDIFFRLVMLWAIFLPLGEKFSIDALRKKGTNYVNNQVINAGSFALIIQLCSMYFFTALLKSEPQWRSEYTALYYTLNLEQFTRPLGEFVFHYYNLMKVLTVTTWWLELLVSAFILFPVFNWAFRSFGLLILLGLQIGFVSMLTVGMFPFFASLPLLALLTPQFWDFLEKIIKKFKKFEKITIYHSEINRHTMYLRILKVFFEVQHVKYESSDTILKNKGKFFVEDKDGKRYFKFNALHKILENSLLFFWLAPIFKFMFFKLVFNFSYYYVSTSNYAKSFVVDKHTKQETLKYFVIVNLICILAASLGFLWNVSTVYKDYEMPETLWRIGAFVRLDQEWSMFAPKPLQEDGWYVIQATLDNGEQKFIFKGDDGIITTFDKPENVSAAYKNQRWKKYLGNLYLARYSEFREGYARYICREWNDNHDYPDEIKTYKMYYMMERSLLNYEKATIEPTVIIEWMCK